MEDLSRYTKKKSIEIETKYISFLATVFIALIGLVFALGVLIGSKSQKVDTKSKYDALETLDKSSGEPPISSVETSKFSFHDTLKRPPPSVPTPASLLLSNEENENDSQNTITATNFRPRAEEPPIVENLGADEPGFYSLQVGSFQEKSDADEMIRKLGKAGYNAFMVSVTMPNRGGVWYRVRVGPYKDRQEIWNKKKEFEEKERIPAFIVKRKV